MLGYLFRRFVAVHIHCLKVLLETFQQGDRLSSAVESRRRAVVDNIRLSADAIDIQNGLACHESQLSVKIVAFLNDSARIGTMGQIDDQVCVFAVFLLGLDILPHDDGDLLAANLNVLAAFRRRYMAHFVA